MTKFRVVRSLKRLLLAPPETIYFFMREVVSSYLRMPDWTSYFDSHESGNHVLPRTRIQYINRRAGHRTFKFAGDVTWV